MRPVSREQQKADDAARAIQRQFERTSVEQTPPKIISPQDLNLNPVPEFSQSKVPSRTTPKIPSENSSSSDPSDKDTSS
jgi:protein RPN4